MSTEKENIPNQLHISEEEVQAYEKDREAKEKAEREKHISEVEEACIPVPLEPSKIDLWVPGLDAKDDPIMEPAGPEDMAGTDNGLKTCYVSLEEYEKAFSFCNSSAPNAHSVSNVMFTKVVDLLRHATGALFAISNTEIPGTVSERLEKVKKTSLEVATGIEKSLGL